MPVSTIVEVVRVAGSSDPVERDLAAAAITKDSLAGREALVLAKGMVERSETRLRSIALEFTIAITTAFIFNGALLLLKMGTLWEFSKIIWAVMVIIATAGIGSIFALLRAKRAIRIRDFQLEATTKTIDLRTELDEELSKDART